MSRPIHLFPLLRCLVTTRARFICVKRLVTSWHWFPLPPLSVVVQTNVQKLPVRETMDDELLLLMLLAVLRCCSAAAVGLRLITCYVVREFFISFFCGLCCVWIGVCVALCFKLLISMKTYA